MRRLLFAVIALLVLPASVGAHLLDHAPPQFQPQTPPAPAFLSGGKDADWELVATIPTGNPHTDLDFFTQRRRDATRRSARSASAPTAAARRSCS